MKHICFVALVISACALTEPVIAARPDTYLRSAAAVSQPESRSHVSDSTPQKPSRSSDSSSKGASRQESPIVLPTNYEATYTYTLPYTSTYLPDGPLSYPVHLWVNGDKGMTRLDTYDGLDSELHRDGAVYYRMPRIDKYSCQWWNTGAHAKDSESTENLQETQNSTPKHTPATFLSTVLRTQPSSGAGGNTGGATHDAHALSDEPTLQEGGGMPDFEEWTYDQDLVFNGVPAERWKYKLKIEETVGNYLVVISKADRFPLYLHMLGSEIVAGAHFDEYVMNFTSFKAVPSNDLQAFDVPVECDAVVALDEAQRPGRPLSLAVATLMPGAHIGHTEYCDFRKQHKTDTQTDSKGDKRSHTFLKRAHTFLHHSTAVKQHNLRHDRKFTMALNKFADWSHDDFTLGMLGFKRTAETRSAIAAIQAGDVSAENGASHRSKFPHTPGFVALPDTIDWRGSGAVGSVKDQGVCGSCWSFSASQAISSAHWMSTGDYISLSEQQIMDCSWNYGYNSACNGGDPDLAVQYSIDVGGSYSEADYPYKGVDDFCKAGDSTRAGALEGVAPAVVPAQVVYIESRNVQAVKEALFKHGPVSIGVDAEPIPFRFYREGVLDTPECSSAAEAIDHAVLLVGYGEEDGVPYWLLKNEWSAHWGDGGYIKVAQANDCGIATEAFFVIANATAAAA